MTAGDLRQPITARAALCWAVQRQRADVGTLAAGRVAPGDFVGRVSADGAYGVLCQASLGARVDCIGSPQLDRGRWLPDDAEALYEAAQALPREEAYLVLLHARCDTTPDWRPELKPWHAEGDLVRRGGRLIGRVVRLTDNGAQLSGCRVWFQDQSAEIAHARGIYARWWAGLATIAEMVTLRNWRITEIGALARPWEKNS